MVRNFLACLAAVAAFSFMGRPADAAPGDFEYVFTENLSGGQNLYYVPLYFYGPSLVDLPGVLQAGEFSFGPARGFYYYFPATKFTSFAGAYSRVTTSIKHPLEVIVISGSVWNDYPGKAGDVDAWISIFGFGSIDGLHRTVDY